MYAFAWLLCVFSLFYQIKCSEIANQPIPDVPSVKYAQYPQIPADAKVANALPTYFPSGEPDELGNVSDVGGVSVS